MTTDYVLSRNLAVARGPMVGSPYQYLLNKHLSLIDITCNEFSANKLLPISQSILKGSTILHLDWIHPLYRSSNSAKTFLKSLLAIIDILTASRIPVIYNVHNLSPHNSESPYGEVIRNFLISKVDIFVSFTNAGLDYIHESMPMSLKKKNVVIPHGSFINQYPNHLSREDARTRLNLPYDARVALFLGRISPYKGIDRLIEEFLKTARSSDWLVIAGQPENNTIATELLRLAAGCPRLLFYFTHVDESDLQIFFNACDFCVFPFRNIFNSGSVILSLSFMKPVIAPATPVLFEVAGCEAIMPISNTKNGLSEALHSAFNANDLHSRGLTGYNRLLLSNDWKSIARDFSILYSSL